MENEEREVRGMAVVWKRLRALAVFLKCTLCQGHYDFSFSDFYFIFVCCVEASK